jgi:hypothetical protein
MLKFVFIIECINPNLPYGQIYISITLEPIIYKIISYTLLNGVCFRITKRLQNNTCLHNVLGCLRHIINDTWLCCKEC